MTADMLYRHMLSMQCRYLKKDMVDSRMKYQETGDSAIRNQVKRTQNTFLHSVKASLFRGFQRKATFYFPIWWGIAAWPVDSFVEENDFTGKMVIPFCTSASSDLGESGKLLAEKAGTGNWQEGMRFRSGVSEEDVRSWVSELEPGQ